MKRSFYNIPVDNYHAFIEQTNMLIVDVSPCLITGTIAATSEMDAFLKDYDGKQDVWDRLVDEFYAVPKFRILFAGYPDHVFHATIQLDCPSRFSPLMFLLESFTQPIIFAEKIN